MPPASCSSICGVATAITTGGAVRATPAAPVLVSSLVVVFVVADILITLLPARTYPWQEPLVTGVRIGLAVKTDGAAVAGGGVPESLIMA